jgi:hypothetical protein
MNLIGKYLYRRDLPKYDINFGLCFLGSPYWKLSGEAGLLLENMASKRSENMHFQRTFCERAEFIPLLERDADEKIAWINNLICNKIQRFRVIVKL